MACGRGGIAARPRHHELAGPVLALVSKIVGPGVAGVAIGMTNTVAFAGVVIPPPIFGVIADQTQSYEVAWIAMAIALPVPLLLRVRELCVGGTTWVR